MCLFPRLVLWMADPTNSDKLFYKRVARHYLCDLVREQRDVKLTSAAYHKETHILITGFSNGSFFVHELPEVNHIHSLRYGSWKICLMNSVIYCSLQVCCLYCRLLIFLSLSFLHTYTRAHTLIPNVTTDVNFVANCVFQFIHVYLFFFFCNWLRKYDISLDCLKNFPSLAFHLNISVVFPVFINVCPVSFGSGVICVWSVVSWLWQ